MMPMDFTKLGTSLPDLQAAYLDRLAEANELLQSGRYGSAIALGLYALEIYLKVRICMRLDLIALPAAFQVHDFDGLLTLSGLKKQMDQLGATPVKMNWDYLTSPPWRTQHVNDLRYMPNSNWTVALATDILQRIQDANDGVLTWLLAQP